MHETAEAEEWKTTFYLMCAVQFVMGMSLTVINPLLPLFLPTIGVTAQHDILLWTGVLTSANLLMAAVASPLWGLLGDRFGRKAMVLRSSTAICVFTALMVFTQNVWMLLAIRVAMGMFAGFASSANTLVATRVPNDRLGFALGWLSTAQMVGAFVGPLLGGVIVDTTGGFRLAFLCTSALAMVVVLVVWRFVPNDRAAHAARVAATPVGRGRSRVLLSILPFFVLLLVAQIALRSVQPVITIYVTSLVPHAKNIATLAGLAFAAAGLADLVGSPLLGKRSDRLGYRRVLIIALIGSAIFTAPQGMAGNYWVFLAERFGVGLFVSSVIPTAQALLARQTDARDRGLAYGIGASATFLGGGIGPLIGAFAATTWGLPSVFMLTTVLLLLACLWVVWRLPREARAQAPHRV